MSQDGTTNAALECYIELQYYRTHDLTGRIRVVDGYAVRRYWPDGSHDYFRLSATRAEAQRGIESDRRYWQRGPIQPVAHRVVAISANDFELHRSRRRCRAPDCPE